MLIVSYPGNGLGNCLRSILSTKILADSIGADFAIDLRHNLCSPDTADTIRTLFPQCLRPDRDLASVRPRDELNCMRFLRFYGTNSDPVIEAIFDPEDTFPRDGFGLLHIYSAKPNRMSLNDYILKKHANYSVMPFPELLKERADQFCRRYDMTKVVGMHIRYTDNLADPLKKNFNTPLPVFEQKLQGIAAQGRAVLLCTDSASVRNYFSTMYAKSLVFPDAVTPALQPLYEMMLLARTAMVIGTYSSTFSYEACLFDGTDLELFEDGCWRTFRFSSIRSGQIELPLQPVSYFGLPSGNTIPSAHAVPSRRDPKYPATWGRVGRNEACPCGSGKKYKHCHGALV